MHWWLTYRKLIGRSMVTILLAALGMAVASSYTIKLAHEAPATDPKGVWATDFKKAVEEYSNGAITVTIYPNGQLYSNPSEGLQAAVGGLVQMVMPSTGYVATIAPQFQVFDLPMLFKSDEALYRFEDSDIGTQLLASVASKNLVGLGYVSNVSANIFSKKPIHVPTDLKGMKIRVYSALLGSDVKALGGQPVTMPASEAVTSLQNGVVSGAITTVTYAAPNQWGEVAPNVTRVALDTIVYPVVMNKAFWDRLPSDLQADVKKAVQTATKQNRDNLGAQEQKALDSLKSQGATIITVDAQQFAQWKRMLQPIYDQYAPKIGESLVKQAVDFNK